MPTEMKIFSKLYRPLYTFYADDAEGFDARMRMRRSPSREDYASCSAYVQALRGRFRRETRPDDYEVGFELAMT